MENNKLNKFGMLIPATSCDLFHKADPRGVPVYDKCPSSGPCFCTGKCRRITGFITDPEKIKEYHAHIDKLNDLLRVRLQGLNTFREEQQGSILGKSFNQSK